jgi:hypothetical protein
VAKRRKQTPLMLLWSRQDQRRFIDAVERLAGLVNDLESLLNEPKQRAKKAAATRRAKEAAREAATAFRLAEPTETPRAPETGT